MKPILITLLLGMSMLLAGCVSSEPKDLVSLSEYPGTTVRVTSSMLKMTSVFAGEEGKFMRKLKSVEVFTCEDPKWADAVMNASRAIAQERGMEVMIETRSAKESVDIYAIEPGKKGVVKEALILTAEPDECNVIYLKGSIDFGALIKEENLREIRL